MIELFVRLYYVWGIMGAITASLYAASLYRSWRNGGGSLRTAPREIVSIVCGYFVAIPGDVWRAARFFISGFAAGLYRWPDPPEGAGRYSAAHALLVGITLGGMSRFFTAIYWAEANREWMEHVEPGHIMVASLPVIFAVIGDAMHHITAWPKHPHRARLISAVMILVLATAFI
jgi:hypothetical protein